MIPKVSVLMAVYNGETYLERSIESVLSQTYRNFEFLIINDASTDLTEDILKKVGDPRIKVVANSINLGLTKSLNKGIELARGQYIARMDADDLSLPYRFEIQVDFLDKHPEYAVLGSSYLLIDQEGRTISLVKVPVDDSQIRESLLKQNCFGHGSVMMRREAVQQIGGYEERFKYSQDYDLWLRIVEAFKVSNIEEALYCWRLSNDSISKTNEWEQKYYASLARFEANRRKNANKIIRQSSSIVSVIIPTYNRPDSLAEAIQSVVDQTYSQLEIIVINDGGIDVSNTVNSFKTKREVKYVKHDHNKGLPSARNTGIRLSSGKYITYLDDDDVYYPWHLEVLVDFLENSEYKAAFTEACRTHQTKENGKYIITKRDIPNAMDFDEDQILINNMIPVLCVMHEKSCLDEVGLFDENLTTHEDWDLWIRMSMKYKFAHINALTCEYRWREDGTTMTSRNREKFIWTIQHLYERYKEHVTLKPKILLERKKYLLNLIEEVYLKKSHSNIYRGISEETKTREILEGDNYRKVKIRMGKSRNTEVISILEEYLNHNPYHVQANIDLAKYYLKLGREWNALIHIFKSLSVESQNIAAMKCYASICFKFGLINRSIHIYINILKQYMNKVKFKSMR